MQSSKLPPSTAVIASRLASRTICKRVAPMILVILASAGIARAQKATDGVDSDRQTIQMLLRRVEQLEARVSQLEAAKTPVAAAAGPGETSGQAATPAPPESDSEGKSAHGMAERMDTSNTLMRIRGFGDVTFHGSDRKGDTTSFTLGQLNLFVTSDISERFKLLSEIVFEADTHNAVGVDIERLLLQYSHNDYLNIAVGRYHTAIGYY